MLAVNHAPRQICPADVSFEMRKAAHKRRGEWEVRTYDRVPRDPPLLPAVVSATAAGFMTMICLSISDACCIRCWKGIVLILGCAGAAGYYWLSTSTEVVRTTLRLKESELPRLCHMYWHGQRNETKIQSTRANMEQVAQTLWPTGSLEDMAMRMLAPAMLTRALSGHRIWPSVTSSGTGRCAGHIDPNMYLTTLLRCSSVGGPPAPPRASGSPGGGDDANKGDGKPPADGKPNNPANLRPPAGAPPGLPSLPLPSGPPPGGRPGHVVLTVQPPAPAASSSSKTPLLADVGAATIPARIGPERDQKDGMLHGGATPADADLLAETTQRTISRGGVTGIVGQNFDKTATTADRQQIVGAVLMPVPAPPNVYNNTAGNCESAKQKRLVEKHVPYTGTKADKEKIGKFIRRAMSDCKKHGIFSRKRIQAWAEEFFHLKDIISKKWSTTQTENAINQALAEAFPELNLKGAVKLEPMQEGKAPRLIIADGEKGQLFAVAVIKCFEDLLFTWFEQKSIKKVGKREAIKRAMGNLRMPGAGTIEGDGSAWDTTNNKDIRGQVENPYSGISLKFWRRIALSPISGTRLIWS